MRYIKKFQYLVIVISFFILMASVGRAQDEKSLNPEIAQLIREVPLKQEYTDAGAVILLREGVMSVEKDGLRNITVHVVGKILDDKAASDYGQISVIFNSYYQEAALDFAHTITKDGTIIEVSKDAIQLKTPPEQPGVKSYTDNKVLTFSPPALEPGSVFEYQVRIRQKKPIIENKWHTSFDFNYTLHKLSPPYIPRIDPVYKSRFVLKVPEGEKFIYDAERTMVSPANGKEGDFTTYTWEVKDLPAVSIEDYMPSIDRIIPMIKLSSLTEWKEIDTWAGRLFFPKIEVTEEIKAKVGEITGEAKTEKEKIEALFYFIQSNIEYIQADLNSGGYVPHSANEILKNRYGDCKDQAILLLSMLRSVGISAYPAFINTYSEVNKKIPSSEAFNHLIVYIPREEGDLWLDTISGVTKFPYLYWIDQDRWAFVIDRKGGKFLRTPASKPEHNQGIIKFDFSFREEIFQGKIIIEGKGAISDNLKSLLKLFSPVQQKDIILNTVKSLFPVIARSQTISVEISDLKNPELPFKSTVSFEIKDIWKKTMLEFSFASNALPLVSFFTKLQNLPQPENRKNDYVLGVNFKLVDEWLCYPPDKDFRSETLPQDQSIDTPLISFRTRYNREGDFIRARSEFTLKQNYIPKKDYKEFYESIQDVLKKSEWKVVFNRKNIDFNSALSLLKEEVKQHPDDPRKHMALAEIYVEKYKKEEVMTYLDEGINESREAVRLSPENDDYHAFLGVALEIKGTNTHDEKLLDEALEEYKEALRIKPEKYQPVQFLEARIYLVKSEWDKKYIDEAIIKLKETTQIRPEFVDAHALLSEIYYKQGQRELAIGELKDATRLKPENPRYHRILGYLYKEKVHSEQNCYDEEAIENGIREYKEVIRLTPQDAEAHSSIGWLYIHKGLYDLALFEAKEALRLNKSAKNHYWLGHAHLYKGNYEEARKEFEEALKLKPDYAEAYLYLASTYFFQNRFEDSIPVFKKYFELIDPSKVSNTYAILHYYLALKFTGKQNEAEMLLQDYAKGFKGKEWESNLISYYQGRLAETDLISRAKNRCDNCDAFYYVGLQYLLNGDKPKAKEYFQKTVETKVYCFYEYVGAQAMLDQLRKK
jgi:tetratricopeptide (TPR) repeat protein